MQTRIGSTLLVDLNLRGVAAVPVANALLAHRVPFVFTTGYGISMIPERYSDITVLQKPINTAALVKALLSLTM